jgi:UDP-N-acetylmuramoyl-L-alanyl-D-glutamate--2,6-diaminopimelate ligase
MMEKSLLELISEYPNREVTRPPSPTIIRDITADSRKVSPGALFVATVGKQINAHQYIPEAIRRGAAAIVG